MRGQRRRWGRSGRRLRAGRGRDVDLLEVFGEVRLGESFDGVVLALVRSDHALKPEVVADSLGDFCSLAVVAYAFARMELQADEINRRKMRWRRR